MKVWLPIILVIYDIGMQAEVFYILMEGTLAVEAVVDLAESNQYPVVRASLNRREEGSGRWSRLRSKCCTGCTK